jgi:hypothetical protein
MNMPRIEESFKELRDKRKLDQSFDTKDTDSMFKKAGNATYNGFNNLGAGLNRSLGYVSAGFDEINKLSSKPLEFARKSFTEAPSFSRKAFWGVAIAATAAVKAVGGAFGIASASTYAAGNLIHEACILSGAAARTIFRPTELSSYKVAGAAFAKLGSEFVMNVTAPVGQLGTELRDLGNKMSIPIVSQGIAIVGSVPQSIAQMTEGAAQGLRNALVGNLKEGGKLIGAGFMSALKTFGSSFAEAGKAAMADLTGNKEPAKLDSAPRNFKEFNEKLQETRSAGPEVKNNHVKKLQEQRARQSGIEGSTPG